MLEQLQYGLMISVDIIFRLIPRPVPRHDRLLRCKIIAHRGEHDNSTVFENTLAAFAAAANAGVWGIECDIRWTRDLVPVIAHDADGRRLFQCPLGIADLTFDELRRAMPLIPSLAELIHQFGGKTHLMLEIKDEPLADPDRQNALLREHLADLVPGQDYHFLALNPELFKLVDGTDRRFCVPVSQLNARRMSEHSLDMNLGGITGHFLLLTNDVQTRHIRAGKPFGTGFIASKNCLFRELNRDVEWIFSNNAVSMQRIRDNYLHTTSV